jgi:hypothetical protein
MQLQNCNQAKNILYPLAVFVEQFHDWIALIRLVFSGGCLLFGFILLICKQHFWILVSSVLLMYPCGHNFWEDKGSNVISGSV